MLNRLCQYEYKLLPDNARVVARYALAKHAIKLDYKVAVSLYRESLSIDPGDASIQFAYGMALVSLSGLEDNEDLYKEAVDSFELARDLDKDSRSYQWLETEFFTPTQHSMWDPHAGMGTKQKSLHVVMAAIESKKCEMTGIMNFVRVLFVIKL